MLRTAEDNFLKKKIELSNDPREAWRIINEQLRGKRFVRKIPTSLSQNGISVNALQRANEFFANTGRRVASENSIHNPSLRLPVYHCANKLLEFPDPSIEEIESQIKKTTKR